MDKPYADMHVHSYYSDGSMSPEEIVESAKENSVGLLAIADHNVLEGNLSAIELCKVNGMQYINAVEIDTMDKDGFQHILAYGFNINDQEFADFLKCTRFVLDEMSVKLVEKMQSDFSDLSVKDFFEYSYDKKLGGWKGIHYLLDKGISDSLMDGARFYNEYGISYNSAGFSSITATAYRIRKAGGFSILSHPGELLDTSDIESFKDELMRIISYGVDGIECYYPNNSAKITQACLDVCNEHNLLITAGSDCHGTFVKNRIGEMDIPTSMLRLKL